MAGALGDRGRCSRSWEEGAGVFPGVVAHCSIHEEQGHHPQIPELLGEQTLPPTGARELGLRPRGPPSSKATWPQPVLTHLPAGTFLANSIFAPLGSSVEIKRLFAVTNFANSDQTI